MQYMSLNNSSLTFFTSKGSLTEMSGSSKYNVVEGEIVRKEKTPYGKIENVSGIKDYLSFLHHDKLAESVLNRLIYNYVILWANLKRNKFTSESGLNRLEILETVILTSMKTNSDFIVKSKLVSENIRQSNSRYQRTEKIKSQVKKINKAKVKGKMYALFGLSCSRKFMAFYSVSFPIGTTDNQAFECWNYWLTKLRKSYNLLNYIWVTERQKNGTLHYHMLTNNYMPILQINRAMAIIINNKVLEGSMDWGSSCLDKFNGVDVDSIWNSKRHKKTGKTMNQSEVRNWLVKYVTKYVTKNTEKFTHLCWHCSRSISMLFCSQLFTTERFNKILDLLPLGYKLRNFKIEEIENHYVNYRSEHNNTLLFKFVPNDLLYETIKLYNDWIFVEFEPQKIEHKNHITFKTVTL